MEIPKGNNYDIAHTGAKAALNIIPIVGGTVAEIFNAIITPPLEKRRQEWMESVVAALQKLESDRSNLVTHLINDDEFATLLISASINAFKTHLTEKHKRLKNGLIHSIDSKIPFDIKQVYLNFVDELTLPHLEVLKFINDFEDKIKSVNEYQKILDILIQSVDQSYQIVTNLEVSTFRFLIKDLDSKGLVFISNDMQDIKNQVFESTLLSIEENENVDLPFIRVTQFGKEFLEFIVDIE